jgi:DNA-binding response OmpR family regulator
VDQIENHRRHWNYHLIDRKIKPDGKSELQERRILIIEDDWDMLQLLREFFLRRGADVFLASNGSQGLGEFSNHRPDLVLVDVIMPEMNGWQVCRHIRQISDVPIIFLTVLDKPEDIIRGLEYGATDYVVKPIDLMVLQARVQAALRQAARPALTATMTIYDDDYLKIDLDRHQVFVRGQQVKLSATEYELLVYLFQNADRVLTPAQISEKVWGSEHQNTSKYIHTYVWRLRRKLEKDLSNPSYILTEYGLGYRFAKQPVG